jgi:hypothetical protein
VSVRDLLATIRREVIAGKVTPTRAGELAMQLSALLGNISDEICVAEMAYNEVYSNKFDELGKASHAEIKAKLTDEYKRLIEVKGAKEATTEMVWSLRKMQDTFRAEMQLQR